MRQNRFPRHNFIHTRCNRRARNPLPSSEAHISFGSRCQGPDARPHGQTNQGARGAPSSHRPHQGRAPARQVASVSTASHGPRSLRRLRRLIPAKAFSPLSPPPTRQVRFKPGRGRRRQGSTYAAAQRPRTCPGCGQAPHRRGPDGRGAAETGRSSAAYLLAPRAHSPYPP